MMQARLWAEFLALFAGLPLLLAYALPPTAMFTVLGLATLAGMVLLHRTPGFAWGQLRFGRVPWGVITGVALVTALVSAGLTLWLLPANLFVLPRRAPELWLMIMVLYPLVSALPQELVFRPLFFERYGALFGHRRLALAVNAAAFSLAHLMYGHPVVMSLTLVGGWLFGWLYLYRGGFPAAVVAHSIAGQILFTSGLGYLFYSGGVR